MPKPPEDFEEKRAIGENDDYICLLSRNDDVVKFISYTQQINLPLSTAKIPDSYFETNLFLISSNISVSFHEQSFIDTITLALCDSWKQPRNH